jgi:hypothetical protein
VVPQLDEHAVPLKNGEALEPVTLKLMVSGLPAGPLKLLSGI